METGRPIVKAAAICGTMLLSFQIGASTTSANRLPDRGAAPISETAKSRAEANFFETPLTFEANQGQTDSRAKFVAHGSGHTVFLTPTEAVMVLDKPDDKRSAGHDSLTWKKGAKDAELSVQRSSTQSVVRMKLVGANENPEVKGLEELPGKVNYFIGNDPAMWRANIPTYGKVEQRAMCTQGM